MTQGVCSDGAVRVARRRVNLAVVRHDRAIVIFGVARRRLPPRQNFLLLEGRRLRRCGRPGGRAINAFVYNFDTRRVGLERRTIAP